MYLRRSANIFSTVHIEYIDRYYNIMSINKILSCFLNEMHETIDCLVFVFGGGNTVLFPGYLFITSDKCVIQVLMQENCIGNNKIWIISFSPKTVATHFNAVYWVYGKKCGPHTVAYGIWSDEKKEGEEKF